MVETGGRSAGKAGSREGATTRLFGVFIRIDASLCPVRSGAFIDSRVRSGSGLFLLWRRDFIEVP